MAIVLISGITQSGKNELARKLEQKGYSRMPTLTSDIGKSKLGSQYVHLPQEYMTENFDKGMFLEYSRHAGEQYGLAKSTMVEALNSDQDQVLVMTPEGVAKVRKYLEANCIQHVAVFLSIPIITAVESLTNKLRNNSLSKDEFVHKMASLAQEETKWTSQAYSGRTFDIVYEIGAKHDLNMIADSIRSHVNTLNAQTHRVNKK